MHLLSRAIEYASIPCAPDLGEKSSSVAAAMILFTGLGALVSYRCIIQTTKSLQRCSIFFYDGRRQVEKKGDRLWFCRDFLGERKHACFHPTCF